MIVRSATVNSLHSNGLTTVCLSCLRQSPRPTASTLTRNLSRHSRTQAAIVSGTAPRLRDGYFSANTLLDRVRAGSRRNKIATTILQSETIAAQSSTTTQPPTQTLTTSSITNSQDVETLPHRKRQAARKAAAQADLVLPPNSSTTLSETASKAPTNSLRRLISVLLSLSKPRLSVLVVLTAMASYSLYPVPEIISPSSLDTPSLSPLTLLFLTTGTALSAASANAFNMLYEPKWDAMMSRTKNRPLVRGLISPRGAAIFAIVAGVMGVSALYYGVNPTVSFLGALNIGLYAGIYTPLKRVHVVNTWVGAIVGGIPPLMGWAAAAGQSATLDGSWRELLLGEHNIGAWLLASLLVAWQFPHFMSLSWSIREEYKNAGYKMLAWTNPARNARVALRYSLLFFPICIGLCYAGITEWTFAVASTPANAWLCKEAVRFWRLEGAKGSARGLFWASVWHLPVVMILAMVEKKGMWQRVWRGIMGVPEDEEEWEEDEDEEFDAGSAKRQQIATPSR